MVPHSPRQILREIRQAEPCPSQAGLLSDFANSAIITAEDEDSFSYLNVMLLHNNSNVRA